MPQDSSHCMTGPPLSGATKKEVRDAAIWHALCAETLTRRGVPLLLLLGLALHASGCASMTSSGDLAEQAIPRQLSDTVDGEDPGQAKEPFVQPSPSLITARTLIQDATQQASVQARAIALDHTMEQTSLSLLASLRQARTTYGLFHFKNPTESYQKLLMAWQNPTGSLSAGTTSRGHLLGAAELPIEGDHHVIIARARPRNTRYGHPTMIALLLHAAEYVSRTHPDAILAIGNIAYQKGGDIRWSVSHNSGRDADIAFFVRDAMTNEPVDAAPDLMMFDDEGKSTDQVGYLFDVERNWQFVRGLLDMHATTQVQYIFISDGLKALLLEHAMKIGEPEEVIAMASDLLRQPAEALPHDDHFHLRLACDLEDRLRGCVDSGPRWSWGNWHEEELTAATHAMIPALKDPDVDVRLAALDYILAIESPVGVEFALGLAAYNDEPVVRQKAIDVASSFYTTTGSALITAEHLILHPETDLETKARLYALLRKSRNEIIIDFVLSRLAATDVEVREKVYAARALGHHMKPELIPDILAHLTTQTGPEVRAELATVLRRITNRSETIDWERASEAQRTTALANWERWWQENRTLPREAWLVQGFTQTLALEPDHALTPTSIATMIDAIPDAPDYLLYNINRSLRHITGKWSSLEQSNNTKLYAMWSKWWKKHRHEFEKRSS